jgi:hypothetical protein
MLEERKLQKAKITVMRNPKFALLQGVMMVGKTYVTDLVPTACTNGRDEHYGRAFVKKLPDRELAFVIAHTTFSSRRSKKAAAMAMVKAMGSMTTTGTR